MGDLVVTSIVYVLTLVAILLFAKGTQRKLLSIGYGFLSLLAFNTRSVLIASAVAIGLIFWLNRED